MKNATIVLDIKNLCRPLATLQARFACAFTAEILKVPQGVDDVFVRVFRAGTDAYFDCPATPDSNGDYTCYMLGTCFPTVGKSYYEIHGKDEQGNDTALGGGKVEVAPFSVNGERLEQGYTITVARIPDTEGKYHAVRAVNIGTAEKPDWAWQIDAAVIEATDEQHPSGIMPDGLGALHQIHAVDLDGEKVPQTKLINGEI